MDGRDYLEDEEVSLYGLPKGSDGNPSPTSYFYITSACDIDDLDFSEMDVEAALSWVIIPTETRARAMLRLMGGSSAFSPPSSEAKRPQ